MLDHDTVESAWNPPASRVHQPHPVEAALSPLATCALSVSHTAVVSPLQIIEQNLCDPMYADRDRERYWHGVPCSVPVTFRRPSSIPDWCAHCDMSVLRLLGVLGGSETDS